MNIRVGTDLVEIERFKRKSTNSPSILKNLFNPNELKNHDPTHLAGIFAAKEAAIKALDLAPGSWLKMEVSSQESGKPALKFLKSIKAKIVSGDLSIAHDGNYVVATFVAILK